MDTTKTVAAGALPGVGDSKEEILEYLRDSGMLDVLREELAAEPSNPFAEAGADGVVEFGAGIGSGGFPWMYWRKADGRIITGPEPRETMYAIYQRKGFKPLRQYGLLPTPGSPVPCCKGKFMRTEQFHCLLARDGAKEFPLEQILRAGWHVNPPVVHGKAVTFPQLAGRNVEQADCDECDRAIYGLEGTNEVVATLRQHAKAAHGLNRRDVDEMLWRTGYYKERKPERPSPRQTPSVCPGCGFEAASTFGLRAHQRSHKTTVPTG